MAEPTGFSAYRSLMRHRVEDILLVASPYDCFVLEEDGRFGERLFAEYIRLNLASSPRFHQVTSARHALRLAREKRPDLVVTTPNCAELTPTRFVRELKRKLPELPVVMLSHDQVTARSYLDRGDPFDHVFQWTGDPGVLFAMVKLVEDLENVARDTRKGNVRVLILVEDSPAFYSSYLPIMYRELMEQTRSLMPAGLNEADRMYRMRARPRILLARTYEEADKLLRRYQNYLLGIVCDLQFPRKGKLDPTAGIRLVRRVRNRMPDLAVLLQSAEDELDVTAEQLEVGWADKNSPELLKELRQFMLDHLGFGAFVFRGEDGQMVTKAKDLRAMIEILDSIPGSSLRYHAERNHFSNWLMARGLFDLAGKVRARTYAEFDDPEGARQWLHDIFSRFLEARQRGQVADYVRGADHLSVDVTRLGSGSMGGKGRGIAFASAQLTSAGIAERYPDVRVFVPRATAICTDVFDAWCDRHGLREQALQMDSDEDIAALFLRHPLGTGLAHDLEALLANVQYPLAVRSSSLYEDSPFQPFAGLYRTILLPNNAPDARQRLEQLSRAIRIVFASTFFTGPQRSMSAAGMRSEEEKMGVIVQRLVGRRHGDRFYPDFAGVAQSRNFYPIGRLDPDDGLAVSALGLGQVVADGENAYRFCPRRPALEIQLSSPAAALRYSQREFLALDMASPFLAAEPGLTRCPLSVAEADGTLAPVGATYVAADDRVVDSIHVPGTRLVNFSSILRYDGFPLAPLLSDLLDMGTAGFGTPVEIEFAVDLVGARGVPELAVVQVRPFVRERFPEEAEPAGIREGELALVRGSAMGHGVVSDIQDVIYVHPQRFEVPRTRAMARVIDSMNAGLSAAGRPYLLVAPGRWGTADPHLGIPVAWHQISAARVMVELASPGFRVDPSLGTHFFHNITSLRVAYFTIDLATGDGSIDLDWLESLPVVAESEGVRHVRLPEPLEARIHASSGVGVVVRPS